MHTDVVAQEAKSQSTLIGKLQDDEINCPLFFYKVTFCLRSHFQLPRHDDDVIIIG